MGGRSHARETALLVQLSLCAALLDGWAGSASACSLLAEGEVPPPRRDDVAVETALIVYGITYGVVAIGAPVAAGVLDRSGRFPTVGILGLSLLTGALGVGLAMAETVGHEGSCGGSDLYEEDVLLYDLLPLALSAAPTLIAWPLSDASFDAPGAPGAPDAPDAPGPRAQLGIGAVARPGEGVLIIARLQL